MPEITVEVKGMEQKKMEKSTGQAIRLTDWADYQEGSVVSRTIIDKKTGTDTSGLGVDSPFAEITDDDIENLFS